MKVGDTVLVTPTMRTYKGHCTGKLPIGNGIGILTRVGQTLVRVRFPDAKTKTEIEGTPCFREDCASCAA